MGPRGLVATPRAKRPTVVGQCSGFPSNSWLESRSPIRASPPWGRSITNRYYIRLSRLCEELRRSIPDFSDVVSCARFLRQSAFCAINQLIFPITKSVFSSPGTSATQTLFLFAIRRVAGRDIPCRHFARSGSGHIPHLPGC